MSEGADILCGQVERLIAKPEAPRPPEAAYIACPAHEALAADVRDTRELTRLTAQMVAPMFRAFSNGGLPAKPAGASKLRLGPLEITGREAITATFRFTLFALVAWAAFSIYGLRVEYDKGKLTIGAEQPRSAPALPLANK